MSVGEEVKFWKFNQRLSRRISAFGYRGVNLLEFIRRKMESSGSSQLQGKILQLKNIEVSMISLLKSIKTK